VGWGVVGKLVLCGLELRCVQGGWHYARPFEGVGGCEKLVGGVVKRATCSEPDGTSLTVRSAGCCHSGCEIRVARSHAADSA